MSELVQLRQRIKAVETIKKITHAMRIISMSTHARLKAGQVTLESYKTSIASLYAIVEKQKPIDSKTSLMNNRLSDNKGLLVIISSQKGLCGNFNTNLFVFVKNFYEKSSKTYDIITIGNKGDEYLKEIKNIHHIEHYENLAISTINTISKTLCSLILEKIALYDTISIISNKPQTFFIQKPELKTIFPFTIQKKIDDVTEGSLDEYRFEQSSEDLLTFCEQRLLFSTMYETLMLSLLAEQAARFIAMDNSTRNASNILETMKLRYNKTRQTKITRELTDLAGNF